MNYHQDTRGTGGAREHSARGFSSSSSGTGGRADGRWRSHRSAALDVLLDDHAAVSEERAGQRLQERPGVGGGVEGLHVAEGRTLAAHDAPRGVDLPVQDHGAAEVDTGFVLLAACLRSFYFGNSFRGFQRRVKTDAC